MLAHMHSISNILLVVILPVTIVLLVLFWWVKRKNTPPDMRWPQRNRKRGKRRSERDIPTGKPR
ncbi:MAG: hypothetical protein SynsKO_26850 [Synoicihabitans sp.]